MKRRFFVMMAVFSMVASLVFPAAVLAANAVLSFGLFSSSCSAATATIDVTLDSAAAREEILVTLSDGTVLKQTEHASGAGTAYNGLYGFGGWTAQPDGTIISLYGYIGQTPPTSADSVEFFIAYRCNTRRDHRLVRRSLRKLPADLSPALTRIGLRECARRSPEQQRRG